MTYCVSITYAAKHYPKLDAKIETKLGLPDGSGLGAGVRDLTWYFSLEKGAVLFFKKAKTKLKGMPLTLTFTKY